MKGFFEVHSVPTGQLTLEQLLGAARRERRLSRQRETAALTEWLLA